ncbi:MAG: hypothetical protein KME12_06705 [Trichocoleus desertorum ATA4-8-CV12]|jgi:hypothetical protein|nr:hypothetical protein [Trichocoleus desertorum ATA4-8-CV12]
MRHIDLSHYLVRLSGAPLAIAGLLVLAIPPDPAGAAFLFQAQRNEYETCAANLLDAGIDPPIVAEACGEVLRPRDLSNCVERITRQTSAAGLDALLTCRQVRRPLELASCVVDINRETENPALPEVLDTCRRSLLPQRFANCVVGLSRRIDDLSPTNAMATCLDAGDPVVDFAPNFIPQDASLPPRFTPLTAPVESPVLP